MRTEIKHITIDAIESKIRSELFTIVHHDCVDSTIIWENLRMAKTYKRIITRY